MSEQTRYTEKEIQGFNDSQLRWLVYTLQEAKFGHNEEILEITKILRGVVEVLKTMIK